MSKTLVGDLEDVFHEQLKAFLFSPNEIANYPKKADNSSMRKRSYWLPSKNKMKPDKR